MRPPELTRITDPALAATLQRLYELVDDLQTRLTVCQTDLATCQTAARAVPALATRIRAQTAVVQRLL